MLRDATQLEISTVIRSRRSIYPDQYINKEIPKKIIEEILENANWAPTHRLTEPWRFKVFTGAAKERLSNYLGDWYLTNTPSQEYSKIKHRKTKNKPLQSGCVIAICMARDPKESVPEWEEIASVACAVQNMWLTCAAMGIGAYWSSPSSILEASEFLKLGENERCLGLFYMGYYQPLDLEGKRTPVEDKIEWMD